ncbi:hypothetical protein [Streptomyces sp. NBC_00212]|uniref:hypothetical protein n=1 Tax=Streptomyces sp. NBC_00212 TaxID=2975684 RepID=UPI002F91B68D
MGIVIALLIALVAAIATTTVFLGRRERARSGHLDDAAGMLIERQHTARAAALRRTYSSNAIHHSGGLPGDNPYKHYS